MFTREKKLIALLLSAALVLTMNTGLFAAVGAEDVVSAGANITSITTASEPTTVVDARAMVSNNKTHEATIKLASSYDVTYYQFVPYYGKSFKAKDFEKFFGKIIISANDGAKYRASKIKVVRLNGKASTSYNAGIQIVKVEYDSGLASAPDKKTVKAVGKALKTATKTKKKDSTANMPVRIYAMNLEYAVSLNQIETPVLKGKSGKYNLSFKVKETNKKNKFKNGKKDLNKAGTYSITLDAAKNLVVSSNDIYGTVSANKFTNSSK